MVSIKKIIIICFSILIVLNIVGCSNTNEKEESIKYDKLTLTDDNIENYIKIVHNSNRESDYSIKYKIEIRPIDNKYKFENVEFDYQGLDMYDYIGAFYIELSDNIYVTQNDIILNEKGEYSFETTESTNYKIEHLEDANTIMDIFENVSGNVLIPREK